MNYVKKVMYYCSIRVYGIIMRGTLGDCPHRNTAILGVPGAVSRVDKMFVVKVYWVSEDATPRKKMTNTSSPQKGETPTSQF